MSTPRDVRQALTVALVLGLVTGSVAALTPTAELRQGVDQMLRVVQDPQMKSQSDQRRAAIRQVASSIFDFQETARRALGRHWQERTPQEREEFVKLFADLLEQRYASQIEQYNGERIVYTGESVDDDHALVKTKIVTTKGTEVPIEYRMLREGDHWRVYDVVIESVSLVGNYRTQFAKIIETESYGGLVQKLKARTLEPSASGKKT
jgi:phospholipid transport system substrate-binding protein